MVVPLCIPRERGSSVGYIVPREALPNFSQVLLWGQLLVHSISDHEKVQVNRDKEEALGRCGCLDFLYTALKVTLSVSR